MDKWSKQKKNDLGETRKETNSLGPAMRLPNQASGFHAARGTDDHFRLCVFDADGQLAGRETCHNGYQTKLIF